MSIVKRCKSSGCHLNDNRCGHTWYSEVTKQGHRIVVLIDDYAISRGLAKGHVVKKTDAKEIESAHIKPDIKAGRDPRKAPVKVESSDGPIVETAAAEYAVFCQGHYRVPGPTLSELRHLVAWFGPARPMAELGKLSLGQAFKAALDAGWRPDGQEPLAAGRGLTAVNRVMQRYRHFLNWSSAQPEAYFTGKSPFHKFGLQVSTKREKRRERRLQDGEEDALFAACDVMGSGQHPYARQPNAGAEMRRRLVGMLALGPRVTKELLGVQIAHVDFVKRQVRFPAENTKAGVEKVVPYAKDSDIEAVLTARRFLKAGQDFAFGAEDGSPVAEFDSAWETLLLVGLGPVVARPARQGRRAHLPDRRSGTALSRCSPAGREALREIDLEVRDLRRECASRWWEDGLDIRLIQLLLGHQTIKMTERYLCLRDGEALARSMALTLGWENGRAITQGLPKERKQRIRVASNGSL